MVAINTQKESKEFIDNIFTDHFRYPREITMDIWGEENIKLSAKETNRAGSLDLSITPYLREPLICLSPCHPAQTVVFMGAIQLGKTIIIIISNAFSIVEDPCNQANVFPNGSLASDFSVQRLAAMIESTPCVRDKIGPDRSRDSSNTQGRKEYPDGILYIVTGGSEISLVSKSLKRMNIDEIDLMEPWVVSMADDRMSIYKPFNKLYLSGHPKHKHNSIIYNKFMNGDQRYYYLACPSCEGYQTLEWGNVKFERDDHYNIASEILYACKHCGDHITEYQMKRNMESRAEWRPHNQENGQYPSFAMNQLYSTLTDASWDSAVKKFLAFRKLKKERNIMYLSLQEEWTTKVLNQPWEEVSEDTATWEILFNRREVYGKDYDKNDEKALINENIVAIFCGVDVQGDRIECQIVGIGLGGELWVLEYKYFYGKTTDVALWANLDEFLLKRYNHPKGRMIILATAIDTGHEADDVCNFVRTRYKLGSRHVFGIKGSSLHGQPILAREPSKNRGINLFSIGTDTAKTKIDGMLKVGKPGPSYVHFPLTLPEAYFHGLTAEKKTRKWDAKKRKFIEVWVNPSHKRNEEQDTMVYCLAAMNIHRYLTYPNDISIDNMLETLHKQVNKVVEVQKPKRRIY